MTPEEVKAKIVGEVAAGFDRAMAVCESPIEASLLLALVARSGVIRVPEEEEIVAGGPVVSQRRLQFWIPGRHNRTPAVASIVPQLMVTANGRDYRIDIAIKWSVQDHRNVFVAVECDGHDYHERTPEQAARDKERDRDLQAAGWAVARFTGREIFHDPFGVATKVWDFVFALPLRLKEPEATP